MEAPAHLYAVDIMRSVFGIICQIIYVVAGCGMFDGGYAGFFHQGTIVFIQAVQPDLLTLRETVQETTECDPFAARCHNVQGPR